MSAPGVRTIGLDVGSTTVKAVVTASDGSYRSRYARHHGALAATAKRLLAELIRPDDRIDALVLTGSGAAALATRLQAPVVHEVSAVTAAVQALHPKANTVFELGGQDAKLVVFDRDDDGSVMRVHTSMNDRCAAGTGVTLDRCLLRLGLCPEQVRNVQYDPRRVRPLSTKCGVFAETDLVNLARAGVPASELVASLADAIVIGNLAVLARGLTPMPAVVLLGGPHVFLPSLADAWRYHLFRLWRERGIAVTNLEQVVFVPPDALLYPAIGASLTDLRGSRSAPRQGREILSALDQASDVSVTLRTDTPLATSEQNAHALSSSIVSELRPRWSPSILSGSFLVGIDAGSTVSKAVVLDLRGQIVARATRRSGDPVRDAQGLLDDLKQALRQSHPDARLGPIAVTGYGAAVIAPLVGASLQVVETVAHATAARLAVPDVDVVCDVGGQDIKVLVLDRDGSIRDFRISSQCNAGIGMVLEATAREFGIPLDRYGRHALAARRAPWFGDGCVVFLDSDRVTFQRLGFTPDEILAGLARALPRVIWTQIMNGTPPASLGRTFVLQGGVQLNPAAVLAQVDYLRRTVPGARVFVHPHPSEAGALGAALALATSARATSIDSPKSERRHLDTITVRNDEGTRCRLCANHCQRTFFEVRPPDGVPFIHVTGHGCEAGATAEPMSSIRREIVQQRRKRIPNLLFEEARWLFAPPKGVRAIRPWNRTVRIGIPRTLPMYRAAPFFRAYLQALGVRSSDVVFSPFTTETLWRQGSHYGATDPCFPVKVSLAHVHYLLHRVHDAGRRLDVLFVPRFTHALTPVRHTVDSASCPVVTASPALVRAAFAVASNALQQRGIVLLDPTVTVTDPELLRTQMFEAFRDILDITRDESDAAVAEGMAAMRRLDCHLQKRARAVLDAIERSASIGSGLGAVLVLCRPYHADPGIHHHVGDELQALGYPVLTIRSIPRDLDYLSKLFSTDLSSGLIEDPYDIRDLLPECDNSGASERLWAARFAARHGRLGVVDLSSFKCAQDAPTFVPIRQLFDSAGVVSCSLHDLDETRPVVSLRMRLRTFAHALREKGLMPWCS